MSFSVAVVFEPVAQASIHAKLAEGASADGSLSSDGEKKAR